MNYFNQFLKDSRSFYDHRCGSRSFNRAKLYSNDPLDVLHNSLNKSVFNIILISARQEYFLTGSDFDILSHFLYGEYESSYRYNNLRWRKKDRSQSTKFRQPKENKIQKKEKDPFKDRIFAKDNRKNHRSKKWRKKYVAKKHRAWVRENLNKEAFLDINIFSCRGDEEYEIFKDHGWW